MIKTCSFFGHRKINITEELKQKLKDTIEDLIINHNVQIFLFGSRSEFDSLCHEVVTQLKENYPSIKRVAYTCKSESCTIESERQELEKIFSKVLKREVCLTAFEEEFETQNKIYRRQGELC